jgi:chromosome segregation ATPase
MQIKRLVFQVLLALVAISANESSDDPSLHNDYKSQYSSIRYKVVLAGLRNATSPGSVSPDEQLRSLVTDGRTVVDNLRFGAERPQQADQLEKAIEQVEAKLRARKLKKVKPDTEQLQKEVTSTKNSINQLETFNIELKQELELRHTEYKNKGHLRQQLKGLTRKIRTMRKTIAKKRRKMVRALKGKPLRPGSRQQRRVGEAAPKTNKAEEIKAQSKLETKRQALRVKLADALQGCSDQECVLNAKLTNAKAVRALLHAENLRLVDNLREADGAVNENIGKPITELTKNYDRMEVQDRDLDKNIEHAVQQNKMDAKLQDMLHQESERRAMIDVASLAP